MGHLEQELIMGLEVILLVLLLEILVRLDNKIPRIAVNPIVGEVSGDVEISYEVVNDTIFVA